MNQEISSLCKYINDNGNMLWMRNKCEITWNLVHLTGTTVKIDGFNKNLIFSITYSISYIHVTVIFNKIK